MRTVTLGLLLLCALLVPRSGLAQPCTGGSCEGGPSLFFTASVGTAVAVAVPGLISGIGNSAYAVRGVHAPTGWLVAGYVSAGLNFGAAAFSGVLLRAGGPQAELGLLIGSAAIGALDLVMTILGHTAAAPRLAAMLPTPLLIHDQSGATVLGVSTPLFHF